MQLPSDLHVDLLVVLGSGMSDCFGPGEMQMLSIDIETTISGHGARLGLLRRERATIAVSPGRRHLYEGVSADEVSAFVEAGVQAGARGLILANAAGGLNATMRAGEIMAIAGVNALLLGRRNPFNGPACGRRLALDPALRKRSCAAALARGLAMRNGVYASVLGPGYETRAEIRMLRRMGVDAVGMSTAPELAAASRLGLPTVAFSLITNVLSDTARQPLDHAEVVEQGGRSAAALRLAIDAAIEALSAR